MLPSIEAPAEGLVGGFQRPRWGEVWAFVGSEGSVTVHRVLGRNRSGQWVMRGDGAPRTDDPVDAGALVGRVQWVRTDSGIHDLRRSRWMVVRLNLRRLRGRVSWWMRRKRLGR